MSGRTLGDAIQHKRRHAEVSPEAAGRKAFALGFPVTAAPYVTCPCCGGWGPGNAWRRGWNRARMEAQRVKPNDVNERANPGMPE
jgi:hypothetical protein